MVFDFEGMCALSNICSTSKFSKKIKTVVERFLNFVELLTKMFAIN